jgi:hypothetical protein
VSSSDGGTSLEMVTGVGRDSGEWATRNGHRGHCIWWWWCVSSYQCVQAGRWACRGTLASTVAVMTRGAWRGNEDSVGVGGHRLDVLRLPGGVGAVMDMRPSARVERGRHRGESGAVPERPSRADARKGAYGMGNGCTEDRCCVCGVNEGGVRVEEGQCLLRVVSGVHGGLALRAWPW